MSNTMAVKADTLKSIGDNYDVLTDVWGFYFGYALCEEAQRCSANLANGIQCPKRSASAGQSMAAATIIVLEGL